MKKVVRKLFLFIIFLFSFSLYCISQREFKRISSLIDKKENKSKKNKTTFNDVRLRIFKDCAPSFLKTDIDTLYIIEKYSVEQGSFYGQIWNRHGNVAYSYTKNKISYTKNEFSQYMRLLVSKWDTTQIRTEEKLYSISNDTYNIYAIYVTKNSKGIYNIKSICFNDFFKVGRDNVE